VSQPEHAAPRRAREARSTELSARLAELDRRLREIQAELSPEPDGLTASSRDPSEITISAGPFATPEAVRAFVRRLAELPEVREAAIRGYEGDDRALIDVQLAAPNT
jgi:hypothetical protein